MVSTPSTSSGALVRGLRESDLKQLKAIANNIRFGTIDGLDQVPGVAIGTRLANELNVKVGDQVSLLTLRGAATALGTAPRVKRYPVAAIFEIGMSEYDASILFMPLNEAQLYFNQPNMVTVLEVVLDSPDDVAKLAPDIVSAGGSSIYVTDWRQRNATFFTALQVERNVMFLILTLIVLVAALNIISGLIMLVKDKGHDIAILRTMGATRAAVMRIFFITGASIGIVGTLAGLLLGVFVCANIERLREFIGWSTPSCSRRSSTTSRSCRPRWTQVKRRRSSSWRSCCRSSPRSILPGGPRDSIPSKRCVTSRARKWITRCRRCFDLSGSSGPTPKAIAASTS